MYRLKEGDRVILKRNGRIGTVERCWIAPQSLSNAGMIRWDDTGSKNICKASALDKLSPLLELGMQADDSGNSHGPCVS